VCLSCRYSKTRVSAVSNSGQSTDLLLINVRRIRGERSIPDRVDRLPATRGHWRFQSAGLVPILSAAEDIGCRAAGQGEGGRAGAAWRCCCELADRVLTLRAGAMADPLAPTAAVPAG
jgi:hypothetical protein